MKQATLTFTKMHGAGNDFVVLDNLSGQLHLDATLIKRLADRHFGVGADQVLVVEHPVNPENDFRYRIFNADGQEVQQCGNGARCFALFVHQNKLIEKQTIRVETIAGVITPILKGDHSVQVEMGCVSFDPVKVPFNPEGLESQRCGDLLQFLLTSNTPALGQEKYWVSVVSVGNPHVVINLPSLPTDEQVQQVGEFIEKNSRFPERVNVGFMFIQDAQNIILRVFERGVGETLACGTGACAAAAVGIKMGVLSNSVHVHKPGGVLQIEWDGSTNSSVFMTGPGEKVFEGEFKL